MTSTSVVRSPGCAPSKSKRRHRPAPGQSRPCSVPPRQPRRPRNRTLQRQTQERDQSAVNHTANAEGPKHLDLTLTRGPSSRTGLQADRSLRGVPVEQALKGPKLSTQRLEMEVVRWGGSTRNPRRARTGESGSTGKGPKSNRETPDEVVAVGAAQFRGGVGWPGEVKDILCPGCHARSPWVVETPRWRDDQKNDTRNIHDPHQKIRPTPRLWMARQCGRFKRAPRASVSCFLNNKSPGTFRLDGIPPSPRACPRSKSTFDMRRQRHPQASPPKEQGQRQGDRPFDHRGALHPLARTRWRRMVKDLEANASADKEKRERIDLKNQAEPLVYQARSSSASSATGER